MLNKQQYLKTVAVFVLISALAVAGISATAFADDHTDQNVETDGEGDLPIRYSTIVGLYGEPFDDSSNEYLIEASELEEYDESTLEQITLNGNVVPSSALPTEQLNIGETMELGVRVNTGVYDQYVILGQASELYDPQGEYVLREPIEGANVQASDQHPEAPQGLAVALDSFNVDGSKVVTATSDTNANQVSEADYTWAVELGPQSGIVQDGSGTYAPSDVVTLLDASNYNDINYDGLDGVYDLENVGSEDDYYPGSLTFTSGSFDGDFNQRPTEGQLELDRGTNHIPVSTQVDVEYTDVNNPTFVDEPVETGTFSEGDQIALDNDFIQVDPAFTSTGSLGDTSIEFDLLSDRQVEASYEIAESSANKVSVRAVAPGQPNNDGTPDERSEWTVIDSRTISTNNNEVLLDTINLIDNDGSLGNSDIEIVEANKGNGVEIRFPDLTGEAGVSSDRFELEYTSLEDTGSGTRETVSDEEIVPFGTPISAGDTEAVANSDVMLEVSGGTVDYAETFSVTMNDQTLSSPDTIDLIAAGDVQSAFNASDPAEGSTDNVEFLRDIDQNVVETFGEDVSASTYLNAINPGQNPSIELGFDVAPEQEIDIAYTHYQDSNLDVTETVIAGGSSGELGPTGQYQINDPRTSEFAMELTGATSGDFDVSVDSGPNFLVSIDEGNFGGLVGSDVQLSQYTYSLGDDRIEFSGTDSEVSVNNDGTAELEYALDHDHTQVDQEFIVELQTEDGPRSDSVTLTSNVPSGNSLGGSGTGVFVVDSLEMGVGIDYAVRVLHDGSVIGQQEIEAGRDYDNYRLNLNAGEDLDDLEDEDVTVRLMRYEGFNESNDWVPVRNENLDTSDGSVSPTSVVQDTATIDSQSGQLSFGGENAGSALDSPLSQDWSLLPQFQPGEKNADDQRVFVNRLNTETEPNGPVNIPVGSEIVVAGNQFEPGDTLTLRREDPEDGSNEDDESSNLAIDLTVEESDTVNEDQIVVNTSLPQVEDAGELEDRFEVVEPQTGDVVFNYGTTDQELQADVDPARINLNRETTADLNISSDLTDYDVLISSEQLDAQELLDLLPSDVENEYNARIEDPDDEEDEQIRLENLNDRPETIELEVSGLSAQEYGLQISAVGSGASDSVTFETAFGSEGDANFADAVGLNDTQTFRVAQGDRARIGIQLEETDTATFSFADSDYELGDVTVESEDGEDVVLIMDTYLADGERVNGDDVSFTDVFSVRGGEFVNTPSLPPVEDAFETGLYPMDLEVDGRETDLATLVVENRETRNVNTWVMPRGVEMSLENLQDQAVQQEQVAMEDTFIIEMQMSGFDSPELLTNETDPAKLVNPYRRAELDDEYDTAQEFVDQEVDGVDSVANASQINLEVEGEKPRNRPSPHMLIGEAEEVETIVEEGSENRLFLFYDLTETKFDNFDSDFNIGDNEDYLADYDLQLNFSESYKYVDDADDTDADLEEEFGVNERVVETRMPTENVGNESLETRFQLQPEANSTVTGETHVAPGTELSVILRDDIEDNVQESPLTLEQEVEVQEGDGEFNNVRGEFDLSALEEGREMTIQFFGINDFRDDAVIAEPQTPPEITELSSSFDGEGIRVGDEVTFDSTIENVDPLSLQYNWDFDDGSESSAPAPTKVFEEAGNYNVSLEVTDPATGLTDTAETQVVVTEVPRTAPEIIELIGPDAQVPVGEANEFAVVARDDQVSADELIYEWDFADGTTATGITATHTYGVADTYEVQVTVSDPENPEELQTTESILVEVTGDEQQDEEQEGNATTFDLTVNAVDSETGEALPNAQVVVQDGSTQEQVDTASTDQSGQYVGDLEEGNYIVQVTASGYEDFSTGLQLTGNDTIQADMVPTDSGGSGNNSNGGNNPDQPGFTLILAAIGLVGAGGYIYYRRRMK